MKHILNKLLLPILGAGIAMSSVASAQQFVVDENFENSSYAQNFDNLQGAGWSWTDPNIPLLSISTQDPDGTTNQSLEVKSGGNITHKLHDWDFTPTNDNPIVFSFKFFDPMTTHPETGALLGGRAFGLARPGAAAVNFVAMGLHNSVTTGTYDVNRYQARVMGGGDWIQLAAERSYGWQEFKAVIHYDTVDIYVNGQLDPNGTSRPRNPGAIIDEIHLGGGLSSATEGLFDDVVFMLDPAARRTITIDQHPSPLTLAVGDNAQFSVVATADGALSYRWEKDAVALFDGSGISGSETDTLSLSSVTFEDDGFYRVALTAVGVTEHSATARLTVHPFLFTQQPVTQVVEFGQDAVFTVEVHGEGPFTYQWQKDGEDLEDDGRISGAETDTLTVGAVERPDSGSYRVVVTNAHGTRTSSAAALSGGPAPTGVRFGDFEEYPVTNSGIGGTIMFRYPSFSGSTNPPFINAQSNIDVNSSHVTNNFPSGPEVWGERALRVRFQYRLDSEGEHHENPWLRLTTYNLGEPPAGHHLRNPIIGLDRYFKFDIHSNHDVYVALSVRDNGAEGEFGSDGGVTGAVTFVGGTTDNVREGIGAVDEDVPPLGRLVRAGEWTTLYFDMPNEPVKMFTAGNPLQNSRGTLDALVFVPVINEEGEYSTEVHEVYLDNFEVTEVGPPPPSEPGVAPTVTITRGAGADVDLIVLGEPSTRYSVEVSTNLIDWTPLGTFETDSEGVGDFIDAEAINTFSRRFYRVSEE